MTSHFFSLKCIEVRKISIFVWSVVKWLGDELVQKRPEQKLPSYSYKLLNVHPVIDERYISRILKHGLSLLVLDSGNCFNLAETNAEKRRLLFSYRIVPIR